jgi:hypothetical protein
MYDPSTIDASVFIHDTGCLPLFNNAKDQIRFRAVFEMPIESRLTRSIKHG